MGREILMIKISCAQCKRLNHPWSHAIEHLSSCPVFASNLRKGIVNTVVVPTTLSHGTCVSSFCISYPSSTKKHWACCILYINSYHLYYILYPLRWSPGLSAFMENLSADYGVIELQGYPKTPSNNLISKVFGELDAYTNSYKKYIEIQFHSGSLGLI